jgi:hypothetical protein
MPTNQFYNVIIHLSTINDDDEKEFIIDKMEQIMLESFAQNNNIDNEEKTKSIVMLKSDHYINDDVLQQVRAESREQNKKYEFISYTNMNANKIYMEFYSPIIRYKYGKKLIDDTMRIILTQIYTYINSARYKSSMLVASIKNDTILQSDIDVFNQDYERYYPTHPDTHTPIINYIATLEGKVENFKIITHKDIMNYLELIFTSDKTDAGTAFRNNLYKIMSKSQSASDTELYKIDKYKYFLNTHNNDNILLIFESITNNVSKGLTSSSRYRDGYYTRPVLFNNEEKKKQILKENMKYVYPDKTNIDMLVDSEKQDIILFHNILYVIQKIYLLDSTIINAKDTNTDKPQLFYVKNLTLEKTNPFIREFIESNKYQATIKFNCNITYINTNPLLKINYIIDDQEILDKEGVLKLTDFDPEKFNKNKYSKPYKSIYIYDTIDYKDYESKINKQFNTIKIQKIIKNKEELFFNDIALNEFNSALNISSTNNDATKQKHIFPNILYFLKDVLKLYRGKEITYNNEKYFIYDTLVTNEVVDVTDKDKPILTFYSITQNKVIKHNNLKTGKLVRILRKKIDTLIVTNKSPANETDSNPAKKLSKVDAKAQLDKARLELAEFEPRASANAANDRSNLEDDDNAGEEMLQVMRRPSGTTIAIAPSRRELIDSLRKAVTKAEIEYANALRADIKNEIWNNDNKFSVYKLASNDNRIPRNTYNIFIVFLCYKADEHGNKPDLQKRIITEVCLDRAKILDKAFFDLFYTKFNIPETFLYNKLINLRKSKKSTGIKNKIADLAPTLETTTITKKKNNITQKIKR